MADHDPTSTGVGATIAERQVFRIGAWRVEPGLNEISSDAGVVRLEPKLMQLLLLLAHRAGQPVTKDEIIEAVWDGMAVTDDVLSQAISKLRRALGDDRKAPTHIATVWKSGYRCIAPVSALDGADAPPVKAGRSIEAIMLLLVFLGVGVAVIWAFLAVRVVEPSSGISAGYADGEFRTITSFPGREADPAMSPDGARVAYSRRRATDGTSDIFVTPASGAGTIQLTNGPARNESPVWSPDGATIAFMRSGAGNCEIMEVPAIGGAATRLAACLGNVYPDLAWSSDGRHLARGGRLQPGEPFAIMLTDLETGEARAVTSPPAGIWGDYDPVFSPDGRSLAFIRSWSEASQDIFVLSLADGTERQLTDERRNIFGLAWLPDEEAILAASNRLRNYDFWRFPLGGEPELVLGGVASPVNPTLSIDGSALAFEIRDNDVNIWRVPFAGSQSAATPDPVPVIASTKWDGHPSISPDGTRVAFASDRTGAFEVWLADIDADGGGIREAQITELTASFIGTPQWSADGRSLVFDARMSDKSRIYLLDILDRLPRPVTDSRSNALNPSWRADGGLLFASDRDGSWSLWKREFGTDEEALVVEGGFYGIEQTPGGDIFYARYVEPGLRRLRTTGEDDVIIPALGEGDWGSWQPDKGGIAFIDRTGDGGVRISRYLFADGSIHPLAVLPRIVPRGDGALALFPDGRGALVSLLDSQESDIVVISGVAVR